MAVIAWTCKLCGHHVEGLNIDEFVQLDNSHSCEVAAVIRRAVRYFRRRAVPAGGLDKIADWLESCAGQADAMKAPGDWAICDEPGSVQHAFAVALATPWEEEL